MKKKPGYNPDSCKSVYKGEGAGPKESLKFHIRGRVLTTFLFIYFFYFTYYNPQTGLLRAFA